MIKHTKIYCRFFNYDISDIIPCEICGKEAVDVHHIDPRGMGGSDLKDNIENLVALCRKDHYRAEHDKDFNKYVFDVHKRNMKWRLRTRYYAVMSTKNLN